MANLRKSPYRCKNLADISYTDRVIVLFLSQISLPWQRGLVGGKCNWQHSMAHPQKPPYGRKNLAKISYASRVIANFVPNFVAMATEVDREKCNWQHSMAHPRKPPYRRKNLAKISYASRVLAHFVWNFVAMATGVGRGKLWLAAFDGLSPKTPYSCKNLLRKPSYSPFCPKFLCHGNGGWSGENVIGSIQSPIPENPPIGAKISQKFLTQAQAEL